MLVKPELERLLPKVDNRYTLAIMIAKRARQLVDGAQPLAKSSSPNLVTIACEELASDKIVCLRGQMKPYIPLKPEIEAARLASRAAAEQADMADKVKDALDQAAGIEVEQAPEPNDIQIITDNLISLSEDLSVTELDMTEDEPQVVLSEGDEPDQDSDEADLPDENETAEAENETADVEDDIADAEADENNEENQ